MMAGAFAGHRWSPIAVDLGVMSLRAVQLKRSSAGPVMHEAAAIEGRPTAVLEDPSDWSARFARVQQLIDRHRFRGRTVAVALDPPWVELRPVSLPAALLGSASTSRAELTEAIRWEVSRVLSFPADEAQFAYWPLPPSRDNQASAMAVAASGEALTGILTACRACGLTCARIDVGLCALVAACARRMNVQPTDIWGVLDLGAHNSSLCVAVGETPVYQRAVPGNGVDLTQRLAAVLEVEPILAEDLKRQYGIQPTTRGHRAGACNLSNFREEDIPGFLFSILRPTLEAMLKEIERAFGYVMQTYPEATAKCLVPVGHGARLKGLGSWLSETLGIPVPHLDAKASPAPPRASDVDDPAMMRALGLALLAMHKP